MNNPTIVSFADDIKLFRTIRPISDAPSLQEDIRDFEINSGDVDLMLNAEKCKVLRITRKQEKNEYNYKLNNTLLESTDYT